MTGRDKCVPETTGTGRIGIDDIEPSIEGGRYPAKAVVGEVFPIRAVVWRDGHDAVAATLAVAGPHATHLLRVPMTAAPVLDTFDAAFSPTEPGLWTFHIEGWSDPIATWRHAIEAKANVGLGAAELANELEIGARLFERATDQVPAADRAPLAAAVAALRSSRDLPARLAPAFAADVSALLQAYPLRELVTSSAPQRIWVDRHRALSGAWYEFFPRSTGSWDENGAPRHGTFATAAADLPRIAAMGFDVVYLPPIHPIGVTGRKGPNNSLVAGPNDVGSPWAIGSSHGGHDAVHPELGTINDFAEFVAAAAELQLEVALDLALQCSPDHPWARDHREWFTVLPDGTIAYAENPPKKYQDIYPVQFDTDPKGLYAEVLRIVLHWVSLGVKIFRVDNPHTKPPNFWEWLIAEVKADHPDVLFLAEAFTRPARLYGLAKRGFTQSYTYFTWRVSKWELTEFGREIAAKAD
ncbi:MAG: DUF3416 domain-containing protein, partial [Rhodococcus sp.]|nr:DUF3416 domain-containing protein [Rhodococcus sp. (in: high G+C Gram-positive bacteria)]